MFFKGHKLVLQTSVQALKSPKSLTKLALLIALYVVIHLFYTIQLLSFVEIRFYFLSVVLAGSLFGPIGGAVVGVAGDVLSFMLRPTGTFFPGFTLNALLTGVIYGSLLYRIWEGPWVRSKLFRIVIAKLLIVILVELLLTPFWLSLLYGEAYLLILQTRLLKTAIFFPLEVLMITALLRVLPKQFWR